MFSNVQGCRFPESMSSPLCAGWKPVLYPLELRERCAAGHFAFSSPHAKQFSAAGAPHPPGPAPLHFPSGRDACVRGVRQCPGAFGLAGAGGAAALMIRASKPSRRHWSGAPGREGAPGRGSDRGGDHRSTIEVLTVAGDFGPALFWTAPSKIDTLRSRWNGPVPLPTIRSL